MWRRDFSYAYNKIALIQKINRISNLIKKIHYSVNGDFVIQTKNN